MSCKECGACCEFIKLPIEGLNDDAKKWLLAHEGVMIGGKNIYFKLKCLYLGKDKKCGIYDKRFNCCREMKEKSIYCSEAKEVFKVF